MFEVNREELYRLYVIEKKPMHTVSKELGIAIGSVYNYLKKYGIKTRSHKETFTMKGRKLTKEQCERISKRMKGKAVSAESRKRMSESSKEGGIGHKKIRGDGYVGVYFPDHPCSNKEGYIMEHILVMEALIGRHLHPEECVHHINENRKDNRKENLQLMTKKQHMSYHAKKRWDKKKGGMTYQ